MMTRQRRFQGSALAACALAFAMTGCAGSSLMWPSTSPTVPAATAGDTPIPKVQDCININSGTPSKYVCNGKQYTSHELRKLREDAGKSSMASK